MAPVKRIGLGWIAVVLVCLLVWAARSFDPVMLRDTDTATLLQALEDRRAPLSWFYGDWPLDNHFYRPVTTLVFELDQRLWPGNAAGFGATNALLAIASILLLHAFLIQFTGRRGLSAAAAVLFGLWHLNWPLGVWARTVEFVPWLFAVAFLFARPWWKGWPAFAVASVASASTFAVVSLNWRMIGWLPGRTASTMAVFALAALACHCRFERLASNRRPRPFGPLDPPATRNTEVDILDPKKAWYWYGAALIATALALGSYEQAVMVPALVTVASFVMRMDRWQTRWQPLAGYWILLFGYLALRWAILPHDTSGYQQQQLRFGPGVYMAQLDYVFPAAIGVWNTFAALDLSFVWVLLSQGTRTVFGLAIYLTTARAIIIRRPWALAGWAMASLAFLPMGWLKPFEHYHYLPAAFRAFFAVALWSVAADQLVSALSRPKIQAPPRPSPAPGSLPRP